MLRSLAAIAALPLALSISACGGTSDDGDSTSAAESGDGEASDGATDAGDSGSPCEEEWADKPNADATNIQETWGSACTTDAECAERLGGENAKCVVEILGVFELPQGYCSRDCSLPSSDVTFVKDAEDCDPAGGVDCIGAMGLFTACAVPCTENSECGRVGYGCERMPIISASDDPTYCLMNDEACCLDPTMCQ